MNREIAPSSIAAPAANYAHAVLSTGPGVLLHTAGVVAIAPDGTVPSTIAEQATVVWANIAAIVSEAGLTLDDVVSVTTYVVADLLGELGAVMAARDSALGGRRVASTLVTVPALVRPEWKVEIAVVAAGVSRLAAHAGEECCDLATTGRRTGRSHEIEIWFAVSGDVLYMVSGNGPSSDWYRNALADPAVTVRLGGETRQAVARDVTDADERRRVGDLMDAKYPSYSDASLGLTHQKWCYEVPALAIESWSDTV